MLASMHLASPTKEPIKGRAPTRRAGRAGLFGVAPASDDERAHRLSRSPSITSAASLNSLPQRELTTAASVLDQQQQEQQQKQQRHSRASSRSPSVGSRRSRSDHPPQFGNEIQPSGDAPGHGSSSRDSQASLGVPSAAALAEAGISVVGNLAGANTALSEEAATFAHAVQEDEQNDQAQAQRGQMLREWVQQTRGTETTVSRARRSRAPSAGSSERSMQGASTPPVPRCHSPHQRASRSPARSSPAHSPTPDTTLLHSSK